MPVERKVTVATVAATLSTFVVWLLNTYVFGTTPDEVVSLVQLVVGLVVTALATFAAGWMARHTQRPDLPATPPSSDQ